jgi:predicted O-methyltransferase YrrM
VEKLTTLLELARGSSYVVELGTAVGWTSVVLLLDDPGRDVTSYDVYRQPLLDTYLRLGGDTIGPRLELRCEPGETGPRGDRPVDLLYIDSDHERDSTIREFRAWEPVLHPGSLVVFDDYTHPDYPGVRDAVAALGLSGEERSGYFVHRVP